MTSTPLNVIKRLIYNLKMWMLEMTFEVDEDGNLWVNTPDASDE